MDACKAEFYVVEGFTGVPKINEGGGNNDRVAARRGKVDREGVVEFVRGRMEFCMVPYGRQERKM